MTIRVLSLNAWGGRLHRELLPYLGNADPDVLLLQEVVRTTASSPEWLLYRDRDVELPQRAHLYDEIRAALPGHDAVFHPTARGTLFDGDLAVSSEFGLASFVRRSLPVIGQATGFVHGAFSPSGWGPHPRARNAHCLRLHSYADDVTVTIAQMHGLRDLAGKGDTPARDAQAEAFARLIEQVRQPGERLVACGDFNILPDSRTFTTLARLGLTDLVTGHGHSDTRTSYYTKSGRFADYLLVSPEVDVIRFEVVERPEVSDHRALLLDMA